MRRPRQILLAALLLCASSAFAQRLPLGVAPALVSGDVDPALSPWISRALAEMSSWELSLSPKLLLEDPEKVRAALPDWTDREMVGSGEIEEIRTAQRKLNLDVLLVPVLRHQVGWLDLELVVSHQDPTGSSRIWRFADRGNEDVALTRLRLRVLDGLDSLGQGLDASARRVAERASSLRWESLVLYARALQDLDMGQREAALVKLRDVARLNPGLPALQVRIRTLEHELQ